MKWVVTNTGFSAGPGIRPGSARSRSSAPGSADRFIRGVLPQITHQAPKGALLIGEEHCCHIVDSPFERLRYSEAVEILERSGQKFEFPVKWGIDLQSEHERYLAEEHVKRPIIVTDYPADIKAFYMYLNDDERTVRAMDVLVPKVGGRAELSGHLHRSE